ncbi:MAG TPA: phosphoesterase [Pirellulales bacterium]|nr:phosphoesterase [Pirellulales bacterium]
MLNVKTEHVLVVPTSLLHELGYFQGFTAEADRYLSEMLRAENTSFQPRGEMEQNPDFKQLIPYVVFRHCDPSGTLHVFQYTRGKGQGEGRLHDKRSVGVGGHICSDDERVADGVHPYHEGLRRELAEEVAIGSAYRERCLGLINDDETEVGRVHLGIVHVYDLDRPAIEPREAEMVECGFRPLATLLDELNSGKSRFESWSEICLRALATIDA